MKYICEECKMECAPIEVEDKPIPYEFWGETGFFISHYLISDCHGASVEEGKEDE